MRVEQVGPYLWRIPPDAAPGMRVPGLVVADEPLMRQIRTDAALAQLANGATLPGIVRAALAMPDIHQGYGLPVGGVVATDVRSGVVSPGAIGFDINCGVRLLRTGLERAEVAARLAALVAARLGLHADGVTLMIHTGSRGIGHQVCTDFLKTTGAALARYGISVPDRQLACAPIDSPEARAYLGAMRAAANFAFANRQVLAEAARHVFERVLGVTPAGLAMRVVYDVAHTIAKEEEHDADGTRRRLLVHRKGATRAFPGQPVIVPGDMGRYSFVLVGTGAAMRETFGSTCHGAG